MLRDACCCALSLPLNSVCLSRWCVARRAGDPRRPHCCGGSRFRRGCCPSLPEIQVRAHRWFDYWAVPLLTWLPCSAKTSSTTSRSVRVVCVVLNDADGVPAAEMERLSFIAVRALPDVW